MKSIGVFLAVATFGAGPAIAQTAQVGEGAFKARCLMCHSVTPGKQTPLGPNLRGVVGAKAASKAFAYSDALKKSNIRWDARRLDAWLAKPSAVIPGTKMIIAVPDANTRKQIIAYLATVK